MRLIESSITSTTRRNAHTNNSNRNSSHNSSSSNNSSSNNNSNLVEVKWYLMLGRKFHSHHLHPEPPV